MNFWIFAFEWAEGGSDSINPAIDRSQFVVNRQHFETGKGMVISQGYNFFGRLD